MSIRHFLILLLLVISCIQSRAAEPQASQDPTDLVKDYFSLLQTQQGPHAAQKYWAMEQFCQHVYGADFQKLTPEDQNKTIQEHQRFMMAAYANPDVAKLMQQLQVVKIEQKIDGDKANVKFDVAIPGKPAKSQEWQLQRITGQWRIVDQIDPRGEPLSSSLNLQYKTTKLNPLEYVKEMTKALPEIQEMLKSK